MKLSLTILLVYSVAVFDLSYSLLCYECNHRVDPNPECDVITENSKYRLHECDWHTKCLTIFIYESDGVNVTMRQCADLTIIDWCENLNSTRAECKLCDTDGCNNSPLELRP